MIREGGKKIYKGYSSGKPLLSIITVVLNGEKYLEQTIQSVITQSYDNYEYIIIDGGSVDRTLDIIQKYDESIDYWISQPDNGISDAFNKGIKLAEGELIGIINSDDWYEPGVFEKVVQLYNSITPDVICAGVQFWESNQKVIRCFSDINNIIRETSIHHSGVFIKKSVYESFGGFNTGYKYAMDYELLLRFKMSGVKFCNLKQIIANRRLEGISYKNRKAAMQEIKNARAKYFSKFNLLLNNFYIWAKDTLGRILKKKLFRPVYKLYWRLKNKNLLKDQVL